jgi:hypothetical protein
MFLRHDMVYFVWVEGDGLREQAVFTSMPRAISHQPA